jgi:hypothetical protein
LLRRISGPSPWSKYGGPAWEKNAALKGRRYKGLHSRQKSRHTKKGDPFRAALQNIFDTGSVLLLMRLLSLWIRLRRGLRRGPSISSGAKAH